MLKQLKTNYISYSIKHITLPTKAAIYFAGGFLLLWMPVSLFVFGNFKKTLLASFDEQLKARAFVIAEKTSTQPRIVPLPQGEENFSIIYRVGQQVDTLFRSSKKITVIPVDDKPVGSNGWRSVRILESVENGGDLEVIFSLPSKKIDDRINELTILLWIVLPIGFGLAALLAFGIAKRLLQPVRQVIQQANAININDTETMLLQEPAPNDELKELIVSFNRMLLRIREQASRQSAFFASASHELRTPLSVMQTRLQVLLQNDTNTTTLSDVYNDQLKDVQRLTKMVNDFLLMSELKSGNVGMTKTDINLPTLLSQVTKNFKDKAAAKQLQFALLFEPVEAGFDIYTDENKLTVILDNLLDNAIKYSPPNSSIHIMTSQHQDQLNITITNPIRHDIDPQIAQLKNDFYHAKPLHGEGFGLGLWIANQLTLMLGLQLDIAITDERLFKVTVQTVTD